MKAILTIALLLCFVLILASGVLAAGGPSRMDAEKRATYQAAAPLHNTVTITRTGSVLKLDYALVGADGRKFSLWDIHDQPKPAFSVYQGKVKVGEGTFEFG